MEQKPACCLWEGAGHERRSGSNDELVMCPLAGFEEGCLPASSKT